MHAEPDAARDRENDSIGAPGMQLQPESGCPIGGRGACRYTVRPARWILSMSSPAERIDKAVDSARGPLRFVIAASLFARFESRQEDSPTMKAVAALRNQFGGHAVQRVSKSG